MRIGQDCFFGRGVRQTMLFNAVIDMFMDKIDKSIGVTAGSGSQEKCNKTAFADDLLLLSSTDIGMKTMLRQLEAETAKVDLIMNPEKCASMRTEDVSKRKQWIVNPKPYLKLQEKEIKAQQKLTSISLSTDLQHLHICKNCQSSKRLSFHFARSSQILTKTVHSKNTFVAKFGSLPHFRKTCSPIP